MSPLKQLIGEIHRRSLWQVLLIYIAASWVVLEVADVLVARLALPEWVYGAAMVLLLVGLPIVLATAFVQEGISVASRHDPTLLPGAQFEPKAAPGPGPGASMRLAALELRAHGYSEAAGNMLNRAIAWFETRRSSEEAAALDSENAQTLYVAGRWDEAKALYEALAVGSPDNVEYLGYLGVIAARLGDEGTARRISDDLAMLAEDRKYLQGTHTRWRARIVAVVDEPQAAVALLRQAFAGGVPHTHWIHTDIDFEPLRDDARFQELVRPKG